MNTPEGNIAAEPQSNGLEGQALAELTLEQEEKLEKRFPNGPQTEGEQLLFTRILMEMATSPDEDVDIEKVEEVFWKERNEVLPKDGRIDYSVDTSGVVTRKDS